MGTTAEKLQNIIDAKNSISAAIEAKGGDVPQELSGYGPAIEALPSGGGSSEEPPFRAVNFLDYDGKILYSYTSADFLSQAELPALPPNTDLLSSVEWNYTYSEITALMDKNEGYCDVGCSRVPKDGSTYFMIQINSPSYKTVQLYYGSSDGSTIDWGDGSAEESVASGNKTSTHQYSPSSYPATYLVSVKSSGTISFPSNIGGFGSNSSSINAIGINGLLKKIWIGNNFTGNIPDKCFSWCCSSETISLPPNRNIATIGSDAFNDCRSLKAIVLPKGLTSIGNNGFRYSSSLKYPVFPASLTSIGQYAFDSTNNLTRLVFPINITTLSYHIASSAYALNCLQIPEGVTSLGGENFTVTNCLKRVKLPSTVTSIGNTAFWSSQINAIIMPPALTATIQSNTFASNSQLRLIDFSSATAVAPTSNAYGGVSNECKIVVPDSLYDDWIVASNWSNYASKIVKASEYNP